MVLALPGTFCGPLLGPRCGPEVQICRNCTGVQGSGELARFDEEAAWERVLDYIEASKADNTLRAYQADWRHFVAWCEGQGTTPLPALPRVVAIYLVHHAEDQPAPLVEALVGAKTRKGLSVATLRRRLTSIRLAHKAAGHEDRTREACVHEAWKAICRAKE